MEKTGSCEMSPGRGFTPGRIDDAEKLEETGVRAVRKLPDFKRGVGPTLDEFPRPRRQAGKTPWTSRGDRFARPKPQIPRKVFRLLRDPSPEYSDSLLKEHWTPGKRSGYPASTLRVYEHHRDNRKNGRSDQGSPLKSSPREKVPETPFTPNRNPYTVFGTGPTVP